jgi:hypothetical protein
MWARVIEIMLGCWLAVSPFIFRHAADEKVLWFNDLFSALAVIMLALISFWPPLRYAHVAIVVVALWLIGFGFWASGFPASPALQNDILVGLLLLMFAIIPNEANLPPRAWRTLLGNGNIRTHGETRLKR